jgi:endonuclease/exonuclease/phosphatase family metal-dependent hydrolase
MGDFNAVEGSVTYNSVTENFLDAKHATKNTSDAHTYNGWNNPEKFKRIDYFMISKKGIKVNSYNVLSGMRNGDYTSDHSPLTIEIELEK